ncbi:MAG: hypothetical protein E6J62_05375 [Deltaproteobacteria bacterium]|nr:MAG: hypothetical protein E6J62_05375 [Deltaproteobacteria bacterium]
MSFNNFQQQKGNDVMNNIRLGLTLLAGAVSSLSMTSDVRAAHTQKTEFPAHLAARAISVSGPEDVGPVEIYVERWSTDEELDKLRGTLKKGPAEMLTVLEQQRLRAGVVLMPGVQGHGERVRSRTPKNFQFAREIITPNGRQVILASDERLGLGETQLDARKEIYEFSLMDIRFGPDGKGVAKVATARDVVYNPKTKTLELKDYDKRPVRLVNVKSAKN